jgi:signal transduction histidine kinase/CheY-like chemotaxis protein
LVIKFPLDLPQGRRVGGFAIDISEQRRLQEEQRKVEQQLIQSQKLESLGVLAGGIAHDFNNLLTAMLGYASLAALDATLSQQTQGYLEQIENAARQAGNLCRQMLAYAGRGQFVIQPVELNHLVHEMAQLLQTAISKQVNLRLQLSPEETMIMADQTQMRQVILNLITNASEALGKNSGTIALTTTSIEVTEQVAAEYRGWSLAGGRHVLLEVADTGMGMSEEIQAKIFEPFFTTKFTGRGLGLAAVQGIVRSHKGAIRIDSKMGQGTRFKILLPTTTQASPPAQPQPVTPTHESGENRWVLVVDDDEAIRELARKTLEHAGFQVTTANDGKEAVEIFQRDPSRYELVLLDLTMPRMGGNQACRHLRAIRPNVLILLMSGYSTHDALAGLDEGLAGFLRKPFRANDLLEAISNLLTR